MEIPVGDLDSVKGMATLLVKLDDVFLKEEKVLCVKLKLFKLSDKAWMREEQAAGIDSVHKIYIRLHEIKDFWKENARYARQNTREQGCGILHRAKTSSKVQTD